MDEAELIGAAQSGDREAFDELVRRTFVDTFTLARRLTGNEEDARDVVQDAYLRAWRGIGKFRGEAQFSTWMYRITANAAATHMRKRRRHATESARRRRSSRSTPAPEAQPAGVGRVGRLAAADRGRARRAAAEAAVARRAEGRVRAPARGDRRGARDLGAGGEGASAPGPHEVAGRAVRRRSRSPCGVTRSPRCCPVWSTASTRRTSRSSATCRRACAARPIWCATASSCATSSCCGRATSSRRRACSATRSPRSPTPPSAAPSARSCPAAGSRTPARSAARPSPPRATALIIARSRRRARRVGLRQLTREPGRVAAGEYAEGRCYPRGPAPAPGGQ